MVPVLYVIAAGLALWGIVVILSGDLVAMLDIATGLFGAAAIVAGLAAVAGALNHIGRTLARLAIEAAETQDAGAVPALAPVHAPGPPAVPLEDPDYEADAEEVGLPPVGKRERREARQRRKAGLEPPMSPAVAETRLASGARAWIARRTGRGEPPPAPVAPPVAPPAPPPAMPILDEVPPEPPVAPPPPPRSQASEIVRSGTLNGVLYRFYADGSVEAVTPTGLRRFASMDELRDAIVAARRRGEITIPQRAEDEPAPPLPPPAPPPVETPVPPPLLRPSILPATSAAAAVVPPLVEAVAAPVEAEPEEEDAVEPPPAPEPVAEEPPPAPPLTPQQRLEMFQQSVWAKTLAELRKPFDEARDGRPAGADDEEPGKPG